MEVVAIRFLWIFYDLFVFAGKKIVRSVATRVVSVSVVAWCIMRQECFIHFPFLQNYFKLYNFELTALLCFRIYWAALWYTFNVNYYFSISEISIHSCLLPESWMNEWMNEWINQSISLCHERPTTVRLPSPTCCPCFCGFILRYLK